MQKLTLYRHTRPDGGVTVSPVKPDGECAVTWRLIADDGKLLTRDGVTYCYATDVESDDGWYEVTDPNPRPVEI
jgi:hypothetical protein